MEDESGSSIDSNKPIDLEHDIENQVYNSDTSEVLNTEFEEGLNEDITDDNENVEKKEKEQDNIPSEDFMKEVSWKTNLTNRPSSYRRLSFDATKRYDDVQPDTTLKNNEKLMSSDEFNNLKKEFNKYSKDDFIQHNIFYRLINTERVDQDFFLSEYLKHIEMQNSKGFTFIDYYTVKQHLKNLRSIRAVDLLQITEDDVHKSVERRKLEMSIGERYDEIERERDYMELEKQKFIIAKDKELLEAQKKYENEVQLYSKDLYGLTCASYCKNIFLCCTKDTVIKDFDKIYEIIKEIPTLNNYEKNLILMRFQTISAYCTKHYNTISRWYNDTQIFIIACSIINPALLSINSNRDNIHYYTIFWAVWISQLLVSLTTSYISFFKWDKKYFLFNCYKTKINQEIWLFIELSGNLYKHKDEDKDNTRENNHSLHLKTFLTRLETLYKKLKMTEFEIETANNEDEGSKDKSAKEIKDLKDEMRSRSSIQSPISPGVSYRAKQYNRDRERDRDRDREMY
jgi:hypothetical protein